jgi:hypothetical protein
MNWKVFVFITLPLLLIQYSIANLNRTLLRIYFDLPTPSSSIETKS